MTLFRVKECCDETPAQSDIFYDAAGDYFDRENLISALRFVYFFVVGKHKPLPALHDCLPDVRLVTLPQPILRCVPLDQIVGSENRSADFDVCFRPVNRALRERWCRVAVAMESGVPLPPVDLIQTRMGYFVRDGNHRVSVARALGLREVDAQIVACEAPALDSCAEHAHGEAD
ncbi:MAG: hypothetical protein RMN25_04080 [Anaerolineae bacterium]|nr:hypothetical protein [Thermoflexales bacterium]MDW8406941.1 hypothetical protein [Anaerolineae bacterium]